MDLTRFDFNAKDWLNSETIERMTDAEIGQFIMLMAKAWMLGKETSLPDDPELLARWAHCKKVSDRVLDKFPVVETEWGSRRRNDVLHKEWLAALNRSDVYSEAGRIGGSARSESKRLAAQNNGNLGGRPKINPSQTQAKPNSDQIISDQTNHIISDQITDRAKFGPVSTRFHVQFGFKPADSPKAIQDYIAAVEKYGEAAVLKKFEEWAAENEWVREKQARFALTAFYRELDERVEAERMKQERENASRDAEPRTEPLWVDKISNKKEEEFTDAI